jgi:enoyl-CoA hydratase/carnithine racemase
MSDPGGGPCDLLLEHDGLTAILTFNRPEARNAMTFETYEEGGRAFQEKRKPNWQGR